MTLEEFRRITNELPDAAEFVNGYHVSTDYDIEITREYGRNSNDGPLEVLSASILLNDI